MSNVKPKIEEEIGIAGIEKLLRDKIHNKYPKDWQKRVDDLIKVKMDLLEKNKDNKIFPKEIENIKKQIQTIKNLKYFLEKDNVEVPFDIPAIGILQEGVVIFPISSWRYVYNIYGLKGIAKIEKIDETDRKYLDVEGFQIFIKDKIINEFAYALPDKETINGWVSNKIDVPTTQEMFAELDEYFRTFLDVPEPMYKILVLFTFQTWLQELLDSVFYLSIMGGFGAGKTSILEMVALVAKKGLIGSSSAAFIARMIDRQGVTLFLDELDSVTGHDEDNELLSIIRQGYRKGMKYARMDKDMEPKFFDIFGCKAFTIHSQPEMALLQRSIPITTIESTESTLPAINSVKSNFAKIIRERLYTWFLDNILLIVDKVSGVDYNNIDNNNIEARRKSIYSALLVHMKSTPSNSQPYGRMAELGFVLAKLAFLLDVDLDPKWSTEVFEIKKEVEEQHADIGDIAILRDMLAEKYRELAQLPISHGYRTQDNFVKIANKEVYELFINKLKEQKLIGCSPKDFVGHLRELGFDGGGRKKMKVRMPREKESQSRLALIFIPLVLKKMGIKEIEPLEKQEKL